MNISWNFYEKLLKLQHKYEKFVKYSGNICIVGTKWEHEKFVRLWQKEWEKFCVIDVK